MLGHGTNRLNQGTTVMAQARAVNGQGSCARGGGSLKARLGQRHWRLRRRCRQGSGGSATALTETGGTLVMAVAELDSGRASLGPQGNVGGYARGGRR